MGVRNWKITPTASPATKGKTDKEDKTVAEFMDALSKDMSEKRKGSKNNRHCNSHMTKKTTIIPVQTNEAAEQRTVAINTTD